MHYVQTTSNALELGLRRFFISVLLQCRWALITRWPAQLFQLFRKLYSLHTHCKHTAHTLQYTLRHKKTKTDCTHTTLLLAPSPMNLVTSLLWVATDDNQFSIWTKTPLWRSNPVLTKCIQKNFFPGLNIWSQYSIHICGDFSSLSSSEVLIMTCAHSFPAESVQEREITSADMACCCFTMHTDRCFQTQNTLAYLKNETHRHTWNTRHDTNTCIHRASLKDKTHRHALHKAAAPLPNGHLASLPWPAAVLDFFGKNYPALQSVSCTGS